GIFIQGQTSSAAVTISDSTLTGNEAGSGGAIGVVFNAGQTPSLRGVTVARNTAHSASGIAGISTPGRIRFQGSIIADNVTLFDGGGTETTNCSLELGPIDDGGNLESHTTCGFTTSAQDVDPKLAAGLDASSPPALAIAAD